MKKLILALFLNTNNNFQIETPLDKYKIWLNDKDKFIYMENKDFKITGADPIKICAIIGGIIGLIWAGIVNDTNSFFFSFIALFKVLVGVLVFGAIGCLIAWNLSFSEKEKTLFDLITDINIHNDTVFENYKQNKLASYNIKNINKEILIASGRYNYKAILIDDENKTFSNVAIRITKSGNRYCNISQAKYSEILKYSFFDKSTSTQVATSTTSSNSGKALGGAIISKALVGNATVGAVIGGNGKRTTETTYKTTVYNNYQIIIYLDRLEDSTITIDLTSSDIANKIVSSLEYIINSNSK